MRRILRFAPSLAARASAARRLALFTGVLLFLTGCVASISGERLPVEERQIVVIEPHSRDAGTAFERIARWGLRNFNFPKDAIAVSAPSQGLIVFKEFGIIRRKENELTSIGYTLTIDVRDERIRFTFTIGEPNDVAITTESDAQQMREYFTYLRESILRAIEEDDTF
jgi:hypothetical protein